VQEAAAVDLVFGSVFGDDVEHRMDFGCFGSGMLRSTIQTAALARIFPAGPGKTFRE
jgi:hypothetical protein